MWKKDKGVITQCCLKKKKKQDTTGILRKGNLPNFEEGREGLRESISLEEIYKQNSDKGWKADVREGHANYKKQHMQRFGGKGRTL